MIDRTQQPTRCDVMQYDRLIQVLKDVAIARGCYKVILDCAEHNVKFYEKCGFARKELQMAYYTPTTTSSSSTTSAPIASKL